MRLKFFQLTLIPQIEVTPVFTGTESAKNRLDEYTLLGCNQTYYDVNFESVGVDPKCKDLLNTVSIYVFDGATGMFR